MGVYNVHGGHNFIVPGAKGHLDETTEDRKVTARVISALRAAGHTVYDCTDDSGRTQGQNLANIVAKCNAHPVDLNISNHLNAGGGTGVEVWCYNEKTKDIAAAICASVSTALEIPNRGVKYSKNNNGHALKVFNASENLAYGCWDDGLYRYGGYYGNGAPSDWAGIMLVSVIFINGEVNGYLKVAWDMSMTQYIMKNNKDGSVAQSWAKL